MSGTTSGVEFENAGTDTHMRIFRGKSISFEVIWGGNTPINVTGFQASLQIRDLKGALMLELSSGNGKVAVDGKFSFSGSTIDSQAVDRVGQWELELTTPTGEVHRALSGAAAPIAEVVQ